MLDKLEFKAAMSSVNVAFKDDAHFTQIYTNVAEGNEKISRDQYIRYLVELNEDRDTPDQIKAAFKALANDNEFISPELLLVNPLTQDDVQFLSNAMPQHENGQGLDYNAYVDQNFA